MTRCQIELSVLMIVKHNYNNYYALLLNIIIIIIIIIIIKTKEGDDRKHQESIRESYLIDIQKICILGSARILRKVLSV